MTAIPSLASRLLGREWVRGLALSAGMALLGGLAAYWAVAAYVIRRADSKIHDILMSHRGRPSRTSASCPSPSGSRNSWRS